MSNYDEDTFESAIEMYLSEHVTYIKQNHTQFDRKLCVDTELFYDFVKESQSREWEYVEKIHKDKTSSVLIHGLNRALDSDQEACLNVFHHGGNHNLMDLSQDNEQLSSLKGLDFHPDWGDTIVNSTRRASDSSGPGRVFFFLNLSTCRKSA